MYPPLIATYFHERRSNREMVAIPRVTQPKPARNPAVAPQLAVVFGSARNAARFAAMRSANRRDRPKILGMLDLLSSASLRLLTDIQGRPNSAFEYQRPPIRKVETAAATTASQLMCIEVSPGKCINCTSRIGHSEEFVL